MARGEPEHGDNAEDSDGRGNDMVIVSTPEAGLMPGRRRRTMWRTTVR